MGTAAARSTWTSRSSSCPAPRSSYADNFSAIASAVQRALGAAGGPRNAIVLADGLSGSTQEYGLGETIMGAAGEQSGRHERPQPRRADLDPLQPRRRGRPGAPRWGWWPEGFLHEMTHNLGAVQWGAPHSTAAARPVSSPQYGHCWQGADVMCYVEDAGAAHPMQHGLRGAPGRDPAELRLRPRRLLQPGAGARLLPGDALEHVRLRVPRAVRRDRPGLRRRRSCGCRSRRPRHGAPTVIGAVRRGTDVVAAAGVWPTRPPATPTSGSASTAAGWEDIDGADRSATSSPATTSAAACASPSSRPTRTAAPAPRRRRRCRSAPRASTAPRADVKKGRKSASRPRPRRKTQQARRQQRRSAKKKPQAERRSHNGGMAESLRGKLILASPVLRDPNFVRTVVLIAEHTDEGAMGLVLNRPAARPSARPCPTCPGWPATRSRSTSAARWPRPR